MSKVISQLEIKVLPDQVDSAGAVLTKILADTRAFEGCESVVVVTDVDDPTTFVAVETWASLAADDAYRRWREGEGAAGLAPLGPLVAAPPVLRRYTVTDV